MPGEPVSPNTTLAIIAGASQFPKSPKLASRNAFASSARDFGTYLRDEDGFGLPKQNLLDLFDASEAQSEILVKIQEFLDRRQEELAGVGGARDLLFFYVGHGGFTPSKDYFLAINATLEGLEGSTSIRMGDLATVIRRAGTLRRYLILDCCFSASAYKEFQTGPLQAAVEKTSEALPAMGTSLLCSSSARTVSMAPEGASHTMFSGALLDVLREGIQSVSRPISMALLGDQVKVLIHQRYADEGVRPEVLSPDQRDDDLKDVPLFPNAALRRRNFDCTITIVDNRNLSIQYTNEMGKPARVAGSLGRDPFAQLAIQRLNEWVNIGVRLDQDKLWKGKPCEPDDLKLIGANLYRILLGEREIRDVFSGLYQRFETAYRVQQAKVESPDLRMRLRLTFHRQADEVARLPWEFLFVPGAENDDELNGFFFAGERTELILTRYVPPSGRISEPKIEPLRIMVAISTPSGENGISNQDKDALVTQLKGITPKVSVSVVQDASWRTLGSALEREKPHIFHFIGYGAFEGKRGGLALVGTPDAADNLYYRDDEVKPVLPFTGQNLLGLFNYDPKPRMVFLHACKTSLGNSAEAFLSQEAFKDCARELVFAKIPAVVAMQYGMSHNELAAFATAMYAELAKGRSLDEAVKAGRLKLGKFFLPKWAHPRFGTPLVYLQNDDPLVLPAPPDKGGVAPEAGEMREGREGMGRPRTSAVETAARAPAAPADDSDGTESSFRDVR